MKQIQNMLQRLAICGLGLAMATTLVAQNASQGTAKVVRISGAARYTTGNNVWQPLRTGADIVSETQLDLQRGRLFGNVKKMSAASRYEVKLPNGVAGIRGTIYTLSSDGVVQVLVGSAVIAYVGPDGNTVTQVVMGGQQFDARNGQVTPIPNFNQKEMVKLA